MDRQVHDAPTHVHNPGTPVVPSAQQSASVVQDSSMRRVQRDVSAQKRGCAQAMELSSNRAQHIPPHAAPVVHEAVQTRPKPHKSRQRDAIPLDAQQSASMAHDWPTERVHAPPLTQRPRASSQRVPAEQAPHEPPQPSLPHSRPPQLGVHAPQGAHAL